MDSTEKQRTITEKRKKSHCQSQLMVKRNLPGEALKWSQEKIVPALENITHLRLDRERIRRIDNLELLSDRVTNVYLQCNCIETIENLECLHNLKFLTLANNRITRLEGLRSLQKLGFLDVSENFIEKVSVEELPQSLIILSVKENPCTERTGYRSSIIKAMPKLQQLDGVSISPQEKREAGCPVSDDEDTEEGEDEEDMDDDDEIEGSIHDYFSKKLDDMMLRAEHRKKTALKQHMQHMDILDKIREAASLPPSARSSRMSGHEET